jgi:DNA-binding response OmpR family regulator
MKILLLEDDVPLNKAITKLLRLDLHEVSSFFDGQYLLDTVKAFNYDVYILDINVPHVNGLELLSLIHNHNSSSKIIMISSNIDLESIQKAYASGCCDYLKKPFHLEELQLKINQFLNKEEQLLQNITLPPNTTLTKKERLLLLLLLEHKSQTVTYAKIEAYVYKDKSMSIDSLRTLVKRLRKKLPHSVIETKIDEGYFIA